MRGVVQISHTKLYAWFEIHFVLVLCVCDDIVSPVICQSYIACSLSCEKPWNHVNYLYKIGHI